MPPRPEARTWCALVYPPNKARGSPPDRRKGAPPRVRRRSTDYSSPIDWIGAQRACGPLTPIQTVSIGFVRPTSLSGAVNHNPSPKAAANFPCPAGGPFLASQIGGGFCGRHFLRKCGRLTAPFRAVGRALPSPTLFRRIHAYSVRSDWQRRSPSAEGRHQASPASL